MLDFKNLGLETINFQVDRTFGNALTAINQKVIDLRDKLIGQPDKTKTVLKYIDSVWAADIVKCVSKHTNLNFKEFVISPSPDGCMATAFSFTERDKDIPLNTMLTSDRYAGIGDQPFIQAYMYAINHPVITADELIKVSESVSKTTGKVALTKFDGEMFYIRFFFDPYISFLPKESVHIKCEYMTAGEITSIILHEVGHSILFCERCSDLYYRMKVYNYIHTYFNKHATLSEKIKYVSASLPKAELPDSQKNTLSDVIKTIDKVKSEQNDDGVIVSSFYMIGAVINFILVTIFVLMSTPLRLIFSILIANNNETSIDSIALYTHAMKTGDFSKNPTNAYVEERLADEYAVRHGYGAELLTAFEKFEIVGNVLGSHLVTSTLNSKILRNSELYYHIAQLPFIFSVLWGTCGDDGIHDPDLDRAENIMRDTIVMFKRQDVPIKIQEHYIAQYESLLKSRDAYRASHRVGLIMDKFWRFVQFFVAPANLVASLVNGKFSLEYRTLTDQLERMIHSPLFYQSIKLQQLNEKDNE